MTRTWTAPYWQQVIDTLPDYETYENFINSNFAKGNFTFHHNAKKHLKRLESVIGPVKGKNIVEFGGGIGALADLIIEAGASSYTIIDLPEIIKYQRMYLPSSVAYASEGDLLLNNPDIFISLWALSETTEICMNEFLSTNFLNAKSVFLACQYRQDGQPQADPFVDALRTRKFIEEFIPFIKTPHKNYYMWKKFGV